MCSRGVYQLKRLTFQFCDLGGSSKGVRDFLYSTQLKEFKEKNQQIEFVFTMKRGNHPHLDATYVNGFRKYYPILNKQPEDILEAVQIARQTFGRKPLKAQGNRIYGHKKSIQGVWQQNMWNQYPIVNMEVITEPKRPDIDYELVDRQTGEVSYVKRVDMIKQFMKMKEPKKKYLELIPKHRI